MIEQRTYCVVLGASGGIGEAISRKLAEAGWSLYLHYNNNAVQVKDLQRELSTAYPHADFQIVQADFSTVDGADILTKQARRVRAIVVANGQSMLKLLTETTAEDMDALWKVHVQNPARFISLVSDQLRQLDTSYVVFIGSIWGNTGAAGEVMYSAVKGAQHAFVKAYAKEAAYSGTRVNAVAPGWIETRMNNVIPLDERQMAMDEIPLMTTGTPEHIAEAVHFLLSGKADYMTGEIMKINGGWYI
ncbi:elongation factor P 5-aminopentanone reductase [Sporosarcina sp. FSL K6-3457]|uniref:elongation factor P 5-aminopentanone reductase n=1 Tax=Sporosarcina sp. FSL K6-3457 TaxID=2978204 RepID=UPI0030F7A057